MTGVRSPSTPGPSPRASGPATSANVLRPSSVTKAGSPVLEPVDDAQLRQGGADGVEDLGDRLLLLRDGAPSGAVSTGTTVSKVDTP